MKNNLLAKKEDKYLRELIPRLSQYRPGQWVAIVDVANDVGDFIDTVQRLVNAGHFNDNHGYCVIDIKEDAFVRLDPDYLRNMAPGFHVWKNPRDT